MTLWCGKENAAYEIRHSRVGSEMWRGDRTCTDDQSRNRRLGLGLGRGQTLSQTVEELGQAIEGMDNVQQLCQLALQHAIELPITEQVRQVLFEQHPPMSAVTELLHRQPGSET